MFDSFIKECSIEFKQFEDTLNNNNNNPLIIKDIFNNLVSSTKQKKTAFTQKSHDASGEWLKFCDFSSKTELAKLLREDPFVYRCFEKPLGYAGDAVMMDYIYTFGKTAPKATALGAHLMASSINTPACNAVRERLDILAKLIDNNAHPELEVFSIACGYAKELGLSTAIKNENFKRFAGLDQDENSLQYIKKCYPSNKVQMHKKNFKYLFDPKISEDLGGFDMVYASGLLDYLKDDDAKKLAGVMFNLLKPQGKMYIINFLDSATEDAFMESFAQWWLIYRSEHQINNIVANLTEDKIAKKRFFCDPSNRIGFLEITKI